MDKVSRGLLVELKDALAVVRACQNLEALQGATDAVKSLAELVAEGSMLLDEYLKRSSPGMSGPLAMTLITDSLLSEGDSVCLGQY